MTQLLTSAIILGAAATTAFAQPNALDDIHFIQHDARVHLAAAIKTYAVTLSKSDQGHNREVFIQAKDSSDARQTARDQNPGWRVENVSEVK